MSQQASALNATMHNGQPRDLFLLPFFPNVKRKEDKSEGGGSVKRAWTDSLIVINCLSRMWLLHAV